MTPQRDMPDFYPWLPGSVRYPLADLGELAARLGSLDLYDRRGELIYSDGFDTGVGGWTAVTSGTGAGVALSAENSLMRPYNALLTAGTSSSKLAKIGKTLAVLDATKLGVEFSFYPTLTFDYIQIQLTYASPDGTVYARMQIDYTDDKLRVYTDDGWVDVRALDPFYAAGLHWHIIKLSCDVENKKYMRTQCNNIAVDLSDYGINFESADVGNSLEFSFAIYGLADHNSPCHVGHCIVTGNEP